MSDIIYLVSQAIATDSYGMETITETKRQVYCEVDSISQNEFFAAANTELNPEHRFTVFFGNYEGESIVEYKGERYSIYRTYRMDDNLELYVERKGGTMPDAVLPEGE